jgi:hypothetical protein
MTQEMRPYLQEKTALKLLLKKGEWRGKKVWGKRTKGHLLAYLSMTQNDNSWFRSTINEFIAKRSDGS